MTGQRSERQEQGEGQGKVRGHAGRMLTISQGTSPFVSLSNLKSY